MRHEELGAMAASPGLHPLGVVAFGEAPEAAAGDGDMGVTVPLPPLTRPPLAEVWLTTSPPERGVSGRIRWAADGVCLFGHLPVEGGDSPAVETAAHGAYRELLRLVDERGYPHLLRVWAAVPRINEREGELERYQVFSRGRARAFEAHYGPLFEGKLSASTGVGSRGGPLVIHFLAGREPGRHVENLRQVSAYHYPREYGPRSPSFARATVLPAGLGGQLLISGTASIVGHASYHGGDLRAQLTETLRNLDELLSPPGGERFAPSLLKVYLRRGLGLDLAREGLFRWRPQPTPTIYLEADICRRELMVEIEAVAEPVPTAGS